MLQADRRAIFWVPDELDYEFNPETFALTSLSVQPGMDVGGDFLTIAGDKILTIGEDVIVVAAEVVRRSELTAAFEYLPTL